MKKILTILCVLALAGPALAEMKNVTLQDINSPRLLESVLDYNFDNAEDRLDAVEAGTMTSSSLTLSNGTEGATASVVMIADQHDEAGDKTAIIGTDSAGIAFQSDASVKGTLASKASIGTDGLISTLVGLDAIGAVDLDIGSADVTEVTVTTDGGVLDLGTTANTLVLQAASTATAVFTGADAADAANTTYDTTGAGAITIGSSDVTAITLSSDSTGTAEVVLPAGSIDSAEILNDEIVDADIKTSAAISQSKLAALAITSALITDGTIVDADIATNALIASNKLSVAVNASLLNADSALQPAGNLTGTVNSVAVATVTGGAAAGATALQPGGNLTGQVNGTAVATVVSGAALGATAVQPSQVWGAPASTPSPALLVNTVAIQASTAAAGVLSERRIIRVWTAPTSMGAASTNNIETLAMSTGVALDTITANADYRYVTTATGTATATVTGTAPGTNYLMVADGSSVSATAITFLGP